MAYDLITRKSTRRDFSLGEGPGPNPQSPVPRTTGEKVAPLLTAGAVALGLWFVVNQPTAQQLREYHARTWQRSR